MGIVGLGGSSATGLAGSRRESSSSTETADWDAELAGEIDLPGEMGRGPRGAGCSEAFVLTGSLEGAKGAGDD